MWTHAQTSVIWYKSLRSLAHATQRTLASTYQGYLRMYKDTASYLETLQEPFRRALRGGSSIVAAPIVQQELSWARYDT